MGDGCVGDRCGTAGTACAREANTVRPYVPRRLYMIFLRASLYVGANCVRLFLDSVVI